VGVVAWPDVVAAVGEVFCVGTSTVTSSANICMGYKIITVNKKFFMNLNIAIS
jgi:hypothetical protein